MKDKFTEKELNVLHFLLLKECGNLLDSDDFNDRYIHDYVFLMNLIEKIFCMKKEIQNG